MSITVYLTNYSSYAFNFRYVWQTETKPSSNNLKVPMTYTDNDQKPASATLDQSDSPQNPKQAVKPQEMAKNPKLVTEKKAKKPKKSKKAKKSKSKPAIATKVTFSRKVIQTFFTRN